MTAARASFPPGCCHQGRFHTWDANAVLADLDAAADYAKQIQRPTAQSRPVASAGRRPSPFAFAAHRKRPLAAFVFLVRGLQNVSTILLPSTAFTRPTMARKFYLHCTALSQP